MKEFHPVKTLEPESQTFPRVGKLHYVPDQTPAKLPTLYLRLKTQQTEP